MISNARYLKKFGSHITTLRANSAISLLAMEDKTGIAISKLMRIELGQVDVTLLTLDTLAKALGMNISEVLVWH